MNKNICFGQFETLGFNQNSRLLTHWFCQVKVTFLIVNNLSRTQNCTIIMTWWTGDHAYING